MILAGDRAIPLPYFVFEKLPPFNSLALLWRFSWLAEVGTALSAAQGVEVVRRYLAHRRPGPIVQRYDLTPLVLFEAAFLSPTHGLPGHVDATPPAAIVALADEPAGTVMIWPAIGALPGLYEQVTHGKLLAASLNFPASRASEKVTDAVRDGREAAIAVARTVGIRYVVLHLDARADLAESEPGLPTLQLEDWERFPVLAEDERVRVLKLW